MSHRCPFVAAVQAGDLDKARRVAQAGDDPVEDAVIPILVAWASDAETIRARGHPPQLRQEAPDTDPS